VKAIAISADSPKTTAIILGGSQHYATSIAYGRRVIDAKEIET